MDVKIIGARLAAARKASGMGPTYVSNTLGVARVTVWRWESGYTAPSVVEVIGYARAIGRSPRALLNDIATAVLAADAAGKEA